LFFPVSVSINNMIEKLSDEYTELNSALSGFKTHRPFGEIADTIVYG